MFIIFKTAFSILRKRKMQSLLIGIVMVLISTMLFLGLSMINQTSPFNTMFDRANAAESLIILSKDNYNIEDTVKWWEERTEVKETLSYESFMLNGIYELNGETETEMFFLTEWAVDSDMDYLYETEEIIGKVPVGNEMLVNYNFASNRNIGVGDTISFRLDDEVHDFKVSGMIVDPQFSTPFINPNRCFISPGYFTENDIENDTTILSIKYLDIENVDDTVLFEKYNGELNNASSPLFINYDVIQNTYNIIFGLIAAILLAVSLFIFIIVIIVIRNTVNNLILQQYKEIGVKKVIGYSNNQIRYSIISFFCLIGISASIIGTIIGLPIRNFINAGISYDIQVGIKSTLDIYLLITVIIVVSLIFIFAYIATLRTGRIKPVQAIKYGMPERKVSKNRISITGTKKVPLGILLAVKQLFANKRKTFSTTLLISLLIYVALIIFNTGGTLTDSDHLAGHLLGQRIGDFSIAGSTEDDIDTTIEKIQELDQVERVINISYVFDGSTRTKDGKNLGIAGQILYGNIPDDFVITADGQQSGGVSEITISTDTARETGKSVGDYITIQERGEDVTFLISGTYNSISFSGYSYTIIQKTAPDAGLTDDVLYWAYTNGEEVLIDDMDTTVKSLMGENVTVSRYDSNVKNILSTVESFPIIIRALLLVFLVVGGVIVLNSTIMDINNSNRVYGIMKSTGFSNRLITGILVIRTLFMILIGSVIGLTGNLLTMNIVMQGIFRVTPFSSIELPVMFDVVGSFVLLMLFIAIGTLGTLIPSKKIGRISPKQLIAE